MELKTKEDILSYVKQNNITFVNLWFPDILGRLNSFSLHKDELDEALDEGMGFDGSSIEGFVRIEESDLIAKPIPSTFVQLPYRPEQDGVALMYCTIHNPDGTRFEGDSLFVLEKQLERMKTMGYDHFYVGPELEFFLFKDNKPDGLHEKVLDKGRYFGLSDDAGIEIRRDIIIALGKMNIQVEYSHHEVAPSQHEIDLRYNDAVTMALNAMTYRRIVKVITEHHDAFASFMPKPLFGENGSGMHVHQSLFTGEHNAFYDPTKPFHLSEIAHKYVAGIITHGREIAAVTNQWVNSYQRLVPGYEAPTQLSWAQRNRSTGIRVPMYKPGKEKATRIEVRFPDPACNIPLAFAMMLGAGLEGIEHSYLPQDPVEQNIFSMSEEERSKRKIQSLPGSLEDATTLLGQSTLAKRILGDHIFGSLVTNQKKEWDEYFREVRGKDRSDHLVTPYELRTLFPIL